MIAQPPEYIDPSGKVNVPVPLIMVGRAGVGFMIGGVTWRGVISGIGCCFRVSRTRILIGKGGVRV
jgi:hypothetical protein